MVLPSEVYYEFETGQNTHGRPSPWHLEPWFGEHYRLADEIPKFGTVYVFQRADLIEPARATAYGPRLKVIRDQFEQGKAPAGP